MVVVVLFGFKKVKFRLLFDLLYTLSQTMYSIYFIKIIKHNVLDERNSSPVDLTSLCTCTSCFYSVYTQRIL